MLAWWDGLSVLAQAFAVAAVFFSTLFVWQLVASFAALDGDTDVQAGHAGDIAASGSAGVHVGDVPHDYGAGAPDHDLVHDAAGLHTFRLLSIRSVLAFGTLFSWAGVLYLQQDAAPWWALLRALFWGLAGALVVAFFFWLLPRLSEEGTARLESAVGRTGTVYLDIPKDGVGQVRVLVGNTIKFVKARSREAQPLPAGTPVRVVRMLDSVTLEVEQVEA